jgi:hypothetical protein
MQPRRTNVFNPKRALADVASVDAAKVQALADSVRYGGNPEHKRFGGEYDLSPPGSPRPGKTLCDGEGSFPRDRPIALLREGLRRGMVSQPIEDGAWPQNVWSVDADGVCYEAQLENRNQGIYHGYPMSSDDAFTLTVKHEWAQRGH